MNNNKGEGPNKRLLPHFVQYAEWLQLSGYTAILCILAIYTAMYIPIIGVIISLFFSVPISLIGIRQGAIRAFLSAVFVAAFMYFPYGYEASMSLILLNGVLGCVFGSIARKTNSAGETIFGLIIIALISKLFFIGLIVYTRGYNPFTIDEYSMEIMAKSLRDSGVGEEIVKTVNFYLNILIPFFLITTSALEAFVDYLLVSKIERRRKSMNSDQDTKTNALEIPPIPPFEQWSFPRSMLSAFFAAFLITLFDAYDTSIVLISVEYNLKALTFVMFTIQGISFTWWLSKIKNFHYGARLSMIILFLFLPIISVVFIAIGMLDIAFNLRQRIRRNIK